jgi:spore maturation protein CgeB
MKILRICPEMPVSTQYIKEKKKELNKLNFDELMDVYRDQNILLPGGWKSSMEDLGHEINEVIYGDVYSQSLWMKEEKNFSEYVETNYLDLILLGQIKKMKPDVVFIYTGALYRLNLELKHKIKAECSSVKCVVALWGDEVPKTMHHSEFFGGIDAIFSCTAGYHDYFKKIGYHSIHTPSSFDSMYSYQNIPVAKKDIDVTFIGNTGYGDYDHLGRYLGLSELFSKYKVEFWGKEKKKTSSMVYFMIKTFILLPMILPEKIITLIIRLIHRLKLSQGLRITDFLLRQINLNKMLSIKNKKDRQFYKNFIKQRIDVSAPYNKYKPLVKKFSSSYNGVLVSGHDYFNVIARSKIVLNLHRDENHDFANIRCFEVTGTGSFLLTDKKAQMTESLFKEDEIAGFENIDDCLEKIKYYLENEDEREQMASKAKRHVLSEHTVHHRNKVISDALIPLVEGKLQVNKNLHTKLKVIYDLRSRPISFDFIFFLQFCHIKMQDFKGAKLIIEILFPDKEDITEEFDWTIDELKDRAVRIIYQLTALFPDFEINEKIVNKSFDINSKINGDDSYHIPNWNQNDHHSEFYRVVNANSQLIMPISASNPNINYIVKWLENLKYKKNISITIRKSNQSPERNTNEKETEKFINYVSELKAFNIVIIPDTDNISALQMKENVNVFDHASIDFNRRLALYEKCDLNFFLNNGPCIASELDLKIKSRLFKLIVPSVPHCTKEFIEWQGYEFNKSPKYNPNSKWVWENDDFNFLRKEFDDYFSI